MDHSSIFLVFDNPVPAFVAQLNSVVVPAFHFNGGDLGQVVGFWPRPLQAFRAFWYVNHGMLHLSVATRVHCISVIFTKYFGTSATE
jgi:hypothetical protein